MPMIGKIRRMFYRDRLTISEISRRTSLSRMTIRKWLNEPDPEPKYERRDRPSKLSAYKEAIVAALQVDARRPRRDRRTAKRLYQEFQAQGYPGGYTQFSQFIAQWRKDAGTAPLRAFVPLKFDLGEAFQFDWSEETIILGGVLHRLQVAHMKLCASKAYVIQAYPSQGHEMLFDAHTKAFLALGGIPRRGIYDNMKTAVKRIGVGKEREFNEQFLSLVNHYMIEPVACTPASGWEKGQVERQVQTLRKQVFEPMLAFATWAEFNDYLADMCAAKIQTAAHPEDKVSTVAQRFELEQAHLTPCNIYEGMRVEWVRVNSLSLVAYDGHKYSVPCDWVGRNVSLHISATHIKVIADSQELAVHPRSFEKQRTTYNPWHYLPALKRKPGALRNGEPFLHWPLPKPIKQIQAHLLKQPKGDRAMVKLLILIAEYGEELGVMAAEIALEECMPTVEAVLNIIHRLTEPVIPKIECHDIPLRLPPQAQLSRYDSLLSKGVA